MQFKVPQFIDIEDTLFGPLTFKQFAYLAGGAGMIFVLYKLLPFFIAVILILPVIGLTLLLTFYKINNKPFVYYLQAGISYAVSSKLYLWKQRLVKNTDKKDNDNLEMHNISSVPMMSSSKLSDLAWSLDVQENDRK